jgi:hypothetical protein
MSPEFLLAFLELLDFQHATKVRIEMTPQGAGREKFEGGREVWLEAKTVYQWKDDDCKRLLSFDQWPYVNFIRIEWESKSIVVDEYCTHITLYGHTSLPDISGLPGQRPQMITMKL